MHFFYLFGVIKCEFTRGGRKLQCKQFGSENMPNVKNILLRKIRMLLKLSYSDPFQYFSKQPRFIAFVLTFTNVPNIDGLILDTL